MRCHRCHAKLEPGRKACPYCGTLVRKKRGSVTLAPEAGGSRLQAGVNSLRTRARNAGRNNGSRSAVRDSGHIDMKRLLLVVGVGILALLVVLMFSCGDCGSCGSCGGCAACGGCASASDVTPSDAPAKEKTGGCASCGRTEEPVEEAPVENDYPEALNSSVLSRQYYQNGTLYYIDSDCIKALSDSGSSQIIAEGTGMTCVCADGQNVYYLQNGNLWRSPLEKPITVSDDPAAKYASQRIVNATVSGSDLGVTRIYEYAMSDGYICYWGINSAGTYSICSIPAEGGSRMIHFTGSYAQVGCYRGRVYWISRNEEDNGTLWCADLATGEKQKLYDSPVSYYVLSDGCVYVYTWINHEGTLHRLSLADLTEKQFWKFPEIKGLCANDDWVYYYTNTDDGGRVCRIAPDGSGNKVIFYDASFVQMTGIADNYIALYVGIDYDASNRYEYARYFIINTATGEQFIVK